MDYVGIKFMHIHGQQSSTNPSNLQNSKTIVTKPRTGGCAGQRLFDGQSDDGTATSFDIAPPRVGESMIGLLSFTPALKNHGPIIFPNYLSKRQLVPLEDGLLSKDHVFRNLVMMMCCTCCVSTRNEKSLPITYPKVIIVGPVDSAVNREIMAASYSAQPASPTNLEPPMVRVCNK
ncbi:hypothetical protein DVH24_026292 [Malus domestica]|uniref:Uncharacterized protein n=1 Tax=Malus domestica TaxID=3750 RepID=A0A498KIB4_MALDO|nr:hypothetical protein DVH24_026292 [Malus domestica]